MTNYAEALTSVRLTFKSKYTRTPKFRMTQLDGLLKLCDENMNDIVHAIAQDLKCSRFESAHEIYCVINEIKTAIYHLNTWIKPEPCPRPLFHMQDELFVCPEPFGVVLIIGTQDQPFQTIFAPLVGAISAGNCAFVKPSEKAVVSGRLMEQLIPKYITSMCYKVVGCGPEEMAHILKLNFDYVFFSGKHSTGQKVHSTIANAIVPTTFELSGKNPVYLDETCNVEVAAKRIWYGKCLHSGQTCLAPDFLMCTVPVEKRFIIATRKILTRWYGGIRASRHSPDYGRIMDDENFHRLIGFISGSNVAFGGTFDAQDCYIEPTILTGVKISDPIMQQEIFGPILPIISVSNAKEAVKYVNSCEKPLNIYVFSNNKDEVEYFINETSSGTITINDTAPYTTSTVPFGGVGASGFGAYHGKYSFDTFSHKKTVIVKSTRHIMSMVHSFFYPPYTEGKFNVVRILTKVRPINPVRYILHVVVIVAELIGAFAYRYVKQHLL